MVIQILTIYYIDKFRQFIVFPFNLRYMYKAIFYKTFQIIEFFLPLLQKTRQLWKDALFFKTGHFKLTMGGEGKIQFTLLLRLCDSVAPLVLILRNSVRKANLSGYISRIQNIFVLLNSSLIRGVMINNIWDLNLKRIAL